MLKRFLIAIRKPIILINRNMYISSEDIEKEEQRLTNLLSRRVVVLNDNYKRL